MSGTDYDPKKFGEQFRAEMSVATKFLENQAINSVRQFERELSEAGKLYPPEFIKELVGRFNIENISNSRVCEVLRSAAWRYLDIKRFPEPKNSSISASARREFQGINKSAKQLKNRLEQLSEPATNIFWQPQRDLNPWLYPLGGSMTPFGHTIQRVETAPDTVMNLFFNKPRILEAIEIVRKLAQRAEKVAEMNKNLGGAPTNEALLSWATIMRVFWERELKRKFTIYNHGQKEPVSEAFVFCKAAMAPL